MLARLVLAAFVATTAALPVSGIANSTNDQDISPSMPANHDFRPLVAEKLTSAITNSNNVQYQIQVKINNANDLAYYSMDCMMVMKDTDTSLIAVFHAQAKSDPGYNGLHLARATVAKPGDVPGTDDWVYHSTLSKRGSMGYFKQVQDSDAIFLAYELENHDGGNRVAIRLYASKDHLLRNEWVREVQMSNELRGSGDQGLVKAGNMGTPSIANIVELEGRYSLSVQFHYYFFSDIPGEGIIDFPREGSGVISSAWPWWGATFNADSNNALRIANAVGKIGQRSLLHPPNAESTTLLLYEAQMANAGEDDCGWLSWRLFLHQQGMGGGAVRLDLEMPGHLRTFANPHANVVGDWIYLNFFVPSQPFDPNPDNSRTAYQPPNLYSKCDGKETKGLSGDVVVNCPTCASEPMQNAEAPANFGSMLLSVKVSDIFG